MEKLKIMSCDSSMNEFAIVLSQKLGIPLIQGDIAPKEGEVYIVLGGQYATAGLINLQRNHKIGYIIYNSETSFRDKFYLNLLRSNPVFDCEQSTTDILKKEHGINVLSHFFYEFMEVQGSHKPVDIGIISKSESELVEKLQKKYPDKVIKYTPLKDIKNPQQLKEFMASCKTFVNVYEGSFNSYMINQALSCGCRVVSHNQADSYTLSFYNEYVTTTDIIEEYDFNSDEDFKPYEELVKQLTRMMVGHNHAIISRIIKS
mgnify:CR=1 FL=1|tara:strand:+ start:52 stop:831 length:780 start_codon:yes stop_codon:yes gene_type:complete